MARFTRAERRPSIPAQLSSRPRGRAGPGWAGPSGAGRSGRRPLAAVARMERDPARERSQPDIQGMDPRH